MSSVAENPLRWITSLWWLVVVFGIAALVILLLAAVLALNEIMDPWASALLVGIVAALVAFALISVLMWIGRERRF